MNPLKDTEPRIGTGERLKQFIKDANFDVYIREGKIISVGLKRGESKRLIKKYGRQEQIAMLNFLDRTPSVVKRFILK